MNTSHHTKFGSGLEALNRGDTDVEEWFMHMTTTANYSMTDIEHVQAHTIAIA